jgi:N-acetylglucosaminyl-diphospho-decaprenol L-rhamnosyltransferase
MAPQATPVVVDNASSDKTVDIVRRYPGVKFIANPRNRGFAAAVNQGARQAADAHYLLLLNPDAHLLTPIDALITAAEQHGIAAGKLAARDQKPQAGFTIRRFPTPVSLIFELLGINRLFPSNPVNIRYRYLDRDLDQPGPVEQPAGAFLVVRRDIWNKLGGLDERFYPVWFEDVDFCRRAAGAGIRIEYVPSVVAEHGGGHSFPSVLPSRRATYWCASLLVYAAKHFGVVWFRLISAAVLLSAAPRMAIALFRERNGGPARAFLKIISFAGVAFFSPGHVRHVVQTK